MAVLLGTDNAALFTIETDLYPASLGEISQTVTCSTSGTVNALHIRVANWNSVTDTSLRLRDAAGNLLGAGNISSGSGTGELSVSITGVAVTAGTDYLLCIAPSNNNLSAFSDENDNLINYHSGSTYASAEDPLTTTAALSSRGVFHMWAEGTSGASNTPPVVNDQTFSVADSASNGTVIGTVVATDSDGTVDNYAISGTQLSINSTTGELTLADNTGLTAGTPITATVTVTDNGGGTDTATVTVNVTNAVLTDTLLDAENSNAAITNETSLAIHVYDTDGGTELYSTASATTDGSGVFVVDDDAIGAIDDTVFVVIKRSNGQTACGTMTVVDGAA